MVRWPDGTQGRLHVQLPLLPVCANPAVQGQIPKVKGDGGRGAKVRGEGVRGANGTGDGGRGAKVRGEGVRGAKV